MRIVVEMDVFVNLMLMFFNIQYEDEGFKVFGSYLYDVYEEILFEMFGDELKLLEILFLECFIEYFCFVVFKEIVLVYDLSFEEVEKEMKKLVFVKKVVKVEVKYGMFWKFFSIYFDEY